MGTNKEQATLNQPSSAEDHWLDDDPGNEDPGSQLDGQVPLRPADHADERSTPTDVEPQ